jgi:hypothetical protein
MRGQTTSVDNDGKKLDHYHIATRNGKGERMESGTAILENNLATS